METKLTPLKNLNICFIAGTLGVGGAEKQLYLIIKALVESGAKVSLICLTEGEKWEAPLIALGINYISMHGKGSRLQRMIKISQIVKKIRPAIVQSQHFYTNLYAVVAARWCGAHSIGASRNELKKEIATGGIFGKPSYMWPGSFVVNSMQSYHQAIELGRKESDVYYLANAVAENNPVPPVREEKDFFTILAMGRLAPQKRFDVFIDMISALKAKGKAIKGILVGSGPLEEDLKKRAGEKGLTGDDLNFIRHTESPETMMRAADIFVLTSAFEGTPNVVLEAMYNFLPVITTQVGNLSSFLKSGINGYFHNGTLEELEASVDLLMAQKETYNSVTLKARNTIEELFSFSALKQNLERIYTQILS